MEYSTLFIIYSWSPFRNRKGHSFHVEVLVNMDQGSGISRGEILV